MLKFSTVGEGAACEVEVEFIDVEVLEDTLVVWTTTPVLAPATVPVVVGRATVEDVGLRRHFFCNG